MPFPSPNLFPGPDLFPSLLPEGTGNFASLLLGATAPWNDPNGNWAIYNAALATMFEAAFDIVYDQGDVTQAQVATLTQLLSTASPITSLPVTGVVESIPANTLITLITPTSSQMFQTTAVANARASSISIVSVTPNSPYPIGAPVQLAYIPGWSTLLDPNNCPAAFLPFLGQFVGAAIPIGLDAATARAQILGESAQHRGTLSAVQSAVTRNLTGTQSVFIQERIDSNGNPNAYWFIVIVKPEEVPNGNAQPIIDAVNAVKPGGVQWTLVQTDAWTISQMEASQASISALEGNFASITGLELDRSGT